MAAPTASAGVPGSALPGPYAVGDYAAALRERLRGFAHVQLTGEACDVKLTRARVYFELRDARGAVPCAMWREDFDRLGLAPGALAHGAQVVVAGGCDFYPGSAASSPHFSFAVTSLRIAGEGDLLARIEQVRRRLVAEGLCEPQKTLARPALPRTIGVVCGERGKARDDVLAGLQRRGWAGRLVWAFAPVQDRHAAPAVGRALSDLAALPGVDVAIVARGGGSLADLLAFCDETLCRTVALLRVPVIASVGHHSDRTLIDDVAAVSCSTPTHAAEAAVPLHVDAAREALGRGSARLARHGRRAVADRARVLARLSRAPGEHVARQRRALHQDLRELRASARRRVDAEERATARRAQSLARRAAAGAGPEHASREKRLDGLAAALAAHDPERTLARGYVLVQDAAGMPVTDAAAARVAGDVRIRFADGSVNATLKDST